MYTQDQWKRLFDVTFAECSRLARVKGGEYSGDDDRLRNFRRAGEDQGLPAEIVWRVYAGKHWDAIGQHIRDIKDGVERVKGEPIEGRAHDLIVYLLLFLAMCEERQAVRKMSAEEAIQAIHDEVFQVEDTFHNPQSTDRACTEVRPSGENITSSRYP